MKWYNGSIQLEIPSNTFATWLSKRMKPERFRARRCGIISMKFYKTEVISMQYWMEQPIKPIPRWFHSSEADTFSVKLCKYAYIRSESFYQQGKKTLANELHRLWSKLCFDKQIYIEANKRDVGHWDCSVALLISDSSQMQTIKTEFKWHTYKVSVVW